MFKVELCVFTLLITVFWIYGERQVDDGGGVKWLVDWWWGGVDDMSVGGGGKCLVSSRPDGGV